MNLKIQAHRFRRRSRHLRQALGGVSTKAPCLHSRPINCFLGNLLSFLSKGGGLSSRDVHLLTIDYFPVPQKNSTSNTSRQVFHHDKASARLTGHDAGRKLDGPIRLSAYIADVDYAPPPSVNMTLLRVIIHSDATYSPLIRLSSPRTPVLPKAIPSRVPNSPIRP